MRTKQQVLDAFSQVSSLTELRDFLNSLQDELTRDRSDWKIEDYIDVCNLSCFDSEIPKDLDWVYSWDKDYLLVQDKGRWEIVERITSDED